MVDNMVENTEMTNNLIDSNTVSSLMDDALSDGLAEMVGGIGQNGIQQNGVGKERAYESPAGNESPSGEISRYC